MKNTETERKFLVKGDFKKDVFNSTHIIQGYLSRIPGRTVRVRIRDDKGYITVKGPSFDGGLSRFEWEKEISPEDARELLAIIPDGYIDKTRHLVRNTDGVHIWEIDEFHSPRQGLVLAEIELSDEDEAFDRPDWLGEEVTGIREYYNSQMIGNQ